MEDGYIITMCFHVRTIAGRQVDEDERETITWSSPQGMFANILPIMDLGPLYFVIRIGEPIAASGKDRKELARISRGPASVLRARSIYSGRFATSVSRTLRVLV